MTTKRETPRVIAEQIEKDAPRLIEGVWPILLVSFMKDPNYAKEKLSGWLACLMQDVWDSATKHERSLAPGKEQP